MSSNLTFLQIINLELIKNKIRKAYLIQNEVCYQKEEDMFKNRVNNYFGEDVFEFVRFKGVVCGLLVVLKETFNVNQSKIKELVEWKTNNASLDKFMGHLLGYYHLGCTNIDIIDAIRCNVKCRFKNIEYTLFSFVSPTNVSDEYQKKFIDFGKEYELNINKNNKIYEYFEIFITHEINEDLIKSVKQIRNRNKKLTTATTSNLFYFHNM